MLSYFFESRNKKTKITTILPVANLFGIHKALCPTWFYSAISRCLKFKQNKALISRKLWVSLSLSLRKGEKKTQQLSSGKQKTTSQCVGDAALCVINHILQGPCLCVNLDPTFLSGSPRFNMHIPSSIFLIKNYLISWPEGQQLPQSYSMNFQG